MTFSNRQVRLVDCAAYNSTTELVYMFSLLGTLLRRFSTPTLAIAPPFKYPSIRTPFS